MLGCQISAARICSRKNGVVMIKKIDFGLIGFFTALSAFGLFLLNGQNSDVWVKTLTILGFVMMGVSGYIGRRS